jgi:hypothetical protein
MDFISSFSICNKIIFFDILTSRVERHGSKKLFRPKSGFKKTFLGGKLDVFIIILLFLVTPQCHESPKKTRVILGESETLTKICPVLCIWFRTSIK